jgi:hypothetical protein
VLERITFCTRVLLDPAALSLVKETLLHKCKESYAAFLHFKNDEASRSQASKAAPSSPPDALISFRQLRLFGPQAGDIDLYDGDDIGKVRTPPLLDTADRSQ